MKKLLILFMAVMLGVVGVCITACNKGEDPTAEVSTESTSEEEVISSSSGKVSRVSTVKSSQSQESLPPAVSNGEVVSSSGSAQASGDSFSVTQTPTEGLSENVAKVVRNINQIQTITSANYQQKGQFIMLAENNYDALTPSEQAQVPNIEDLRNARKAYDGFVYSVAVQYIDEFKSAVLLIADFSDDQNYQSLVSSAEAKYNLVDDKYKGEIQNEYNTVCAAKVHAKINLVPDPSSVTGEYYTTVENLQKELSGLSGTIKNAYVKFSQDTQKLADCFTRIMANMVEKYYIVQDSKSTSDAKSSSSTKGDGILDSTELSTRKRRYDTNDGFFNFYNSNGSNAWSGIQYSDSVNGSVTIYSGLQSGFEFNAPASGILTLYTRQQKQYDYRVFVDGIMIGHFMTDKTKSDDESFILKFEIPKSGKVEVLAADNESAATSTSNGYFYAVKFLYSSL